MLQSNKGNPPQWGRLLRIILKVCLVVFIWQLIILLLDRTADRTPVLAAGEGITPSAGITGC